MQSYENGTLGFSGSHFKVLIFAHVLPGSQIEDASYQGVPLLSRFQIRYHDFMHETLEGLIRVTVSEGHPDKRSRSHGYRRFWCSGLL